MANSITKLFGIKYPVVQGGMVWCSGWKLASAVSNNGGLGLLGAGSMYPEVLREHIAKMKEATAKPWGINVPLLYPNVEELIDIIIEEGVKVVFTSAGNPAKYTQRLKDNGIVVAHVIANSRFAKKCEDSGVDVLVAEGFEAGGHNSKEETTTMVLVPQIKKATHLPLIAAGGIGSGRAMAAAMALGADGVQIGSRFAVSKESSAHPNFMNKVLEAGEGGTLLTLKQLGPVRLIHNMFSRQVEDAERRGASVEELKELLGKGRAKKGIFLGDLDEGELEIGQVSSMIERIMPVKEIMEEIIAEYKEVLEQLTNKDKYWF
ncbi:NAD(P)H-dependent flavin oxidoreductase [Plebeiibacterium marinum]|uniref:Nitronate monooxygenase family protein n=1 Tax=Plebeiibacterium marinum TaxID=2992111 RepID=A0AAE3ME95_9BACT|nr:nitronate monooxygenase family protein [Plebeiobacterium marinum]MCW3806001.1 nitronate monooxygenase family protein [Plebeiobacterium marinum]